MSQKWIVRVLEETAELSSSILEGEVLIVHKINAILIDAIISPIVLVNIHHFSVFLFLAKYGEASNRKGLHPQAACSWGI